MLYNGLPMRISRFTSALPVSSIVSYYNREWPGQTVINEVGGKTVIGHAHGEYYVTIEVSAKGSGSQSQIGITRLLKRKPDAAAGADFPKPSGTQVINDITYLDTPGRSLSMESTLSPFQTDAFYASRLPADGWSRSSGPAVFDDRAAVRCPLQQGQPGNDHDLQPARAGNLDCRQPVAALRPPP